MNITSTQYTLSNKSLEIYLSGCNGNPKCTNCHNPMLWDFSLGNDWIEEIDNITIKINLFNDMVDNIMIFGGEPLDQNLIELQSFLKILSYRGKHIWLFTRYELENISNEIKYLCDYIKCGRYEESLTTDTNIQYGIKLATSNQHIYKKGIDY
jgi:anaerobic ribonucleoside-triphosphate reductase activating protein